VVLDKIKNLIMTPFTADLNRPTVAERKQKAYCYLGWMHKCVEIVSEGDV
jgi:hypothetical protein